MSGPGDVRGAGAVVRFLRPRSIAIVGISARAGSPGQVILQSLKLNNFSGDIHLVGRASETIDGRCVLKSADQLPAGVDLAVFTMPAAAVREAVEGCARRKVGCAMIFAAGFAEVGDHAMQDAVAEVARAAGLAIIGPNCLGITNNVDGLWLHMLYAREAKRGVAEGIAFVGQSGGLLGHFQRAADGRNLPLAYVISTGNEAGLESTDFLEFLADDPATRVIALYCEHIRRPQEFLAACRRARAAGKPVVLMQAGRTAKARKAAASHTGALIGNWATMKTQAEDAGALVVSTMDEMMDVIEILARYPVPPTRGPGIITASGAYVALTNDFAEEIGLEIPELEPATLNKVREVLPSFGNYGNPLDVTAGFGLDALPIVVQAVLDDANVGMLFISFPVSYPGVVQAFNKGMADSPKPKVMVALGDTWALAPEIMQAVNESPGVFSRSSDRMLRAIALYTHYGRSLARTRVAAEPRPFADMPKLGKGPQPEWLSKRVLSSAGIRVPEGELASNEDTAAAIAERIGYPIVLKAQAAALSHKTEAGAVILDVRDGAALHRAWARVLQNVNTAMPGLKLDGCLVEKMSGKGVELMIGAKRDGEWGTVLLVGLGGIWVEALGDVQVLPADADEAQIAAALHGLRAAKLLNGFRGLPPADVDAVASALLALGRLMRSAPQIVEIDVNPLMVYAKGQGATALDALIVVE
jgi:acetate---CoA ligase (ADP-forming)